MKHLYHSCFRFLLFVVFLLASCQWSIAATKYVSNSGNNSNSGNSLAQAWLTLQWAEDHIGAGDSVWIANGTYTGFDVRTTGNAANPIVFISIGNSAVINLPCGTTDGINVENANYIEIKGVRVINQPRNGIRLVNAHHCIVRNTYCDNNFERGIFTGFTDDLLLEFNECLNSIDEHGIYVSNSSDRSIIRYNICHHNNRGGIQINADESQGGDGISTDPEIYGNVIYENGAAGGAAINLDGVQSAFIYNNLLYENHATGIALFREDGAQPSINAVVVHNTIVNAANGRWCILAVNGSSGAQVYNNILIHQGTNPSLPRGSIALDPDAVPGFASDYNMVINKLSKVGDGAFVTLATWKTYGYDEHSFLAGPVANIFITPGSDYHLLTNSPAVDAGSSTFSFGVNTDIEGIIRPQGAQHDIGAYELQGALAIDTDQEDHPYVKKPDPGIVISQGTISWPDDLEGRMNILSVDGKVIAKLDISVAGAYSFQELIPGIYAVSVYDENGVQWSRWFVWSGM
ncbi:MAG TPA: right-handed parallel beta-helix repeat-containing protein [Saprospiraceae bacterium]|nr:right-handed parallel beta-helix repeat-containing protein [Saprospiraceae bacterium]